MEPAESPIIAPEGVPSVATVGAELRPALLLWLVSHVLIGLQAQYWAFAWTPQTNQLVYLVTYEVGYLAFCGLVLAFVWRDAEARRVFARPRPRMVELCVLIGVVAALVLWGWENQIPSAWVQGAPQRMEHDVGLPVMLSLVSTAVLPALFEEWMCRGLLQQRFLRVMPVEMAIGMQAMLFALMHCSAVMMLPHLVFGVVAGVLRVAAGALWPCMLMHLLWNGCVVLSAYGVL